MNAPRVHKKCESEKTNTPSTSKPQCAKNSAKLVKVLRDLAVEIHNHAAKMEKVVEEIGHILEDMALLGLLGSWMGITSDSVASECVLKLYSEGQLKAPLQRAEWIKYLGVFANMETRANKVYQAVTRIGSEETVTSNYVVPVVELSSDEEEVQHVRLEAVKRIKLASDPQTFKPTAKTKPCDKVDTLEGRTRPGSSAAIVIDISDDSSG
ncbi:hypothetical protein F511_13203 [Dorcoceras hygrometricum]|uniref:Uncharacterized protein n=1 Tax=Dorcoceras hygrometricum TaxID=472368 RepID=A0A2Z7APB9_9LAMI|nr:hypothetical protein F511_13203 [Dorcoceras hygrometricum]